MSQSELSKLIEECYKKLREKTKDCYKKYNMIEND